MGKKIFFLTLIFVMTIMIGCAKKEAPKRLVLPPQIPIAKPEMYVPERYEYKSSRERDPFVSLIVEQAKPVAGVSGTDMSQISIADLELSGIIWDKKEAMAILHDGNKFGYILKKGRLFADNFKPIKGIEGKIIGNKLVFLQQGKTKVNFSIDKPKKTTIEGTGIVAQKEKEFEEEEEEE